VTSVAKPIVAAVAMYFTFSMVKPGRRVALSVPLVPTNAVIKPVILPQATKVPVLEETSILALQEKIQM
jgi:hypothetical protein